jgi:hypothetical protein
MEHFSPAGQGENPGIASHGTPLIGPYDSRDPAVLEFQMLTMKLAGIDGIVIDWYGTDDHNDYAVLHAASQRAVETADQMGLEVAVCYEDRTLRARVEDEDIRPEQIGEELEKQIAWLNENWFERDNYVRLEDRPVLLVFGPTFVQEPEPWQQALSAADLNPLLFTLHYERGFEDGLYDWPLPGSESTTVALGKQQDFASQAGLRIPVAFPGFQDIYAEAGLHESYGTIDSRNGDTFRETLSAALNAETRMVQIATWNDWGEGTMIEPSEEERFFYLEILQSVRRSMDSDFRYQSEAFAAAQELYEFRKDGGDRRIGDEARNLLLEGETQAAMRRLHGNKKAAASAKMPPPI